MFYLKLLSSVCFWKSQSLALRKFCKSSGECNFITWSKKVSWFYFNSPKLHFYTAQALSRPPLYLWLWVSCQVLSTISRHWTLGTKTWLGLPVQLKILFWKLAEINIVVLKLCCSDKFFWLKLWISEILLSHLWTVLDTIW